MTAGKYPGDTIDPSLCPACGNKPEEYLCVGSPGRADLHDVKCHICAKRYVFSDLGKMGVDAKCDDCGNAFDLAPLFEFIKNKIQGDHDALVSQARIDTARPLLDKISDLEKASRKDAIERQTAVDNAKEVGYGFLRQYQVLEEQVKAGEAKALLESKGLARRAYREGG